MQSLRFRRLVLLVPVLGLAVALASCGGGKPTTQQASKDGDEQKSGGELKALDSKGWGTLKGRITLAGDKPNVSAENDRIKAEMDKHKDKDGCISGASEDEKTQQRWKVSEQGGVANVFNEEPPQVSQNAGNYSMVGRSVLSSQYDYIGRRVFVSIQAKF